MFLSCNKDPQCVLVAPWDLGDKGKQHEHEVDAACGAVSNTLAKSTRAHCVPTEVRQPSRWSGTPDHLTVRSFSPAFHSPFHSSL